MFQKDLRKNRYFRSVKLTEQIVERAITRLFAKLRKLVKSSDNDALE